MSLGPRLRHRVTFATQLTTRDTNGDRVTVLVPVSGLENVPAEVLTGAGREAVAAGQPQSSVAARITLRYQAALREPYGMSLEHDGQAYHVTTHYFDATGRRWVTLVCEKGFKDA